jgi:gliding motility-associated-like protein
MKALSTSLLCLVFLASLLIIPLRISAQCGKGTPSYSIDLRGNPDSIWYSPSVARGDTCCSSTNCIEFVVQVDPSVIAIKLDITAGAIPTGSLFYKIDCGASTSVGQPLCLSGSGGPYRITFCKPGNNQNVYRLTPITQPSGPRTVTVSEGCSALLTAEGFVDSTITWKSISGTAYDGYLSCKSGCSSTSVSPTGTFPTYVDYMVCGKPACQSITVCDTVRVFFVKDLVVQIPAPKTLCHNDTAALLTAQVTGGKAPYSYIWSTGATTASIYGKPGSYWVQVLDKTNCGAEFDSVIVTKVPGKPTANAGRDTTICSTSPASLKGQLQNVTDGYWVGAGTLYPSAQDLNTSYTPTFAEMSSGTAKVWLVTKGTSGCPEDSDEVTITIIKEPNPLISGTFQLCGGRFGVKYSVTGAPGNTYQWSVTGGALVYGQGSNSISINWGYGDSGVIVLTETNPTGCKTTIQKTVKLLRKARPVIAGPDSACSTTGGHMYSVQANAGDLYSWSVIGGSIQSGQGTNSVVIKWANPGTGTVILKESAGPCDSIVKKTVKILPIPAPVVLGPANVCQYDGGLTYYVAIPTGSTLQWSVDGGIITSAVQNTVQVQWGKAGIGHVSVTEINASGCSRSTNAYVTIHGRPLVGILGDSNVCEFSTHGYSPIDTSQATNQWIVESGSPLNDSDKVQPVRWGKAGIGTIVLKQINAAGCDTTYIKDVAINGRPEPFILGKDTVCAFTAQTYEIGFTAGHTYNWMAVNGDILGGANTPKVTVQWKQAGVGTLLLRETNVHGCDSMVKASVYVSPYPEPSITGKNKVCENSGPYHYATPIHPGSSYRWLVAGGVIIGNAQTHQTNINWASEGKGVIIIQETNAAGCVAYDTVVVTIQRLRISMEKQILYPCNPSPVSFKLSTNDTLLSILWVFGDGSTSGELAPHHTYEKAGTYTVKLYATSLTGCIDSSLTTVTIYPNPQARFDVFYPRADRIFYNLEDTVEFTNRSIGGTRYEWDFADGHKTTFFDTRHLYQKPGNYSVKLKAWNELGCVDSIIIPIVVDAHVLVLPPNAFTPTGDGLNEGFSVPVYNVQSLNVQIFNRWGQRVFESDDLNFRWDGRYKGELVQQDVYVYVIQGRNVKGETFLQKGDITILR